MNEKALKERLVQENEAFRKLYEEHQLCERKLEELKRKNFLSEEEMLEEKALKKRKLSLKDKMYLMMTEFQKTLS